MQNTNSADLLSLQAASTEDLQRIESLMQFYNYDLSEWCPVEFSPSGLYALRPKGQYWATKSVKPYVARVRGELAGFAVIDDEVLDQRSDFNLGYFFLGRRYRGGGLAKEIFRQIFLLHPGNWEVYFFASNVPAARFWPNAISLAGGQNIKVEDTVADGLPSRLIRFSTNAP